MKLWATGSAYISGSPDVSLIWTILVISPKTLNSNLHYLLLNIQSICFLSLVLSHTSPAFYTNEFPNSFRITGHSFRHTPAAFPFLTMLDIFFISQKSSGLATTRYFALLYTLIPSVVTSNLGLSYTNLLISVLTHTELYSLCVTTIIAGS